jgi:hypothetical protein
MVTLIGLLMTFCGIILSLLGNKEDIDVAVFLYAISIFFIVGGFILVINGLLPLLSLIK